MTVTLSFDVEEFDFPHERGKDIPFQTQLDVSTDGLTPLISLLDELDVRATFYTTANYAQHCPQVLSVLIEKGHEIASHDFYHTTENGLKPLESKLALEKITGKKILGYRSPRLADISSTELQKAGYLYNSSLNPTFIPFRYNNLNKPRNVFHDGAILNFPASVSYPLRIPLFWISFHSMTYSIYLKLAKTALKKDGHLHLYFHPWEFSERLKEPEFGVPSYISNCSGNRLLDKLKRLIVDLKTRGCTFDTTKDYLRIHE